MTFATAITCIDGRVHAPLTAWMRERYGVDHVDLVTTPGADRTCARGAPADLDALLDVVQVSVLAHRSTTVVVTGHAGCAAHPVDDVQHHADIAQAIERVRSLSAGFTVEGAWIAADGHVTAIQPADGQAADTQPVPVHRSLPARGH